MTATSTQSSVQNVEVDRTRSRITRGLAAAILLLMLVLPFLIDPIGLRRTAGIMVLTLAVLGVVVATGYGGLISLGHGAFVGLGAFTMGGLLDQVGLPFPIAIAVTFVFCCLVGWLLGLPALRIKGIYLALITLGLAVVFPALAKRFPELSGGTTGRPVDYEVQAPQWLGSEYDITWRYYVCLLCCALMFFLTVNVLRSRVGRAIQAVRDDETAAATFGVNLVSIKAGAFALSVGLAGTAGALQVILFPFVSPSQFGVFLSLRLYAAAIIGGAGYVIGAVYGVVALLVIPAINGAIGLLDNDVIVFGIGLILLTFVSPDGIAGWLRRTGWLRSPGRK